MKTITKRIVIQLYCRGLLSAPAVICAFGRFKLSAA